MSCASSIASLAVTFIVIALVLSVCALFLPFWMFLNMSGFIELFGKKDTAVGLFLTCFEPYSGKFDCQFNSFDNKEDWVKACMALWAIGTFTLVLCGIAAFFICCESCRTPKFASFITFGSLLAALCLCITVIIYGVKSGDLWDREKSTHYDWGYYVAILAGGFSLLSFLLFGCSIHCLRSGN